MEHKQNTENQEARELAAALRDLFQKQSLTLSQARRLLERAREKAGEMKVPMVITVVDEGGNLVALERMDGALLASIAISQAKAYTAAALRTSTSSLEQKTLPGKELFGLHGFLGDTFCFLGGGLPIVRNGFCVGGIGVSGGSVPQDEAVAAYALQELP